MPENYQSIGQQHGANTSQVILRMPQPHSKMQAMLMHAFKMRDLVEMQYACGSKWGKTLGLSGGFTAGAVVRVNGIFRWIAPIYSQSKIGFRHCQKLLPKPPLVIVNKGDLSITIPPIDMRLEYKSGKNPEDLEGEGVDGNVLDEAAKLQAQVHSSVKTTVSITRGPIIEISTPRGKNHFYDRCMESKARMEWALKHDKPLTHIFMTAPTSDNPFIKPEVIEEARHALPDRLYRQYFEAEFMDDGDVFVGFRDCVMDMETLDLSGKRQTWFHPDCAKAQVVIGADWAKTHDRTVFWAIDLPSRRCVAFKRFYKTPYPEAIRQLVHFSRKFKDVVNVDHDKTGLGNVIDDYLAETELPYRGVTFTNQVKNALVTQLATGLSEQDTWLPNWPEMIKELDQFEVRTSMAGNLTYGSPEGDKDAHDDIVIALALAYNQLLEYGGRGFEVQFLDDLNQKPKEKKPDSVGDVQAAKDREPPDSQSALERFYKDLADDADDD